MMGPELALKRVIMCLSMQPLQSNVNRLLYRQIFSHLSTHGGSFDKGVICGTTSFSTIAAVYPCKTAQGNWLPVFQKRQQISLNQWKVFQIGLVKPIRILI